MYPKQKKGEKKDVKLEISLSWKMAVFEIMHTHLGSSYYKIIDEEASSCMHSNDNNSFIVDSL